MSTQNYYDKHAQQLLQRYQSADMSDLHTLLQKEIPPHSKVLDIGFGAARELEFLYQLQYDIYGIDSTELFVSNAKKRFSQIEDHFIRSIFPFKSTPPFYIKFDAIISIALWMHLKHQQYEDGVNNIASMLNPNQSVVIVSFSQGSRSGRDERLFVDVDTQYLENLFYQHDLKLVKSITTRDSLKRDDLVWITQVYKYD